MTRCIFVISRISYFIRFPRITSYHAAFFHGIANRQGEWYPFDTKTIDASFGNVPPLTVWFNRHLVPSYCEPGSWPVVSEAFRNRLSAIPNLKFLPVKFGRVVDSPWQPGKPITVSPAGLSQVELLGRLAEVDCGDLENRFEMMSFRLHKVMIQMRNQLNTFELKVGTPPGTEDCKYAYNAELLEQYPVHHFEGSLVFVDHVWDLVAHLIDKDFYIVRKYDLSTGKLVEYIGPAEE